MVGSNLLFVLGLGRSGTTALTELFSAHPQIAIGMERYKYLYPRRRAEIAADLFQRDRFFDFSDGLTNITPEVHQRWTHYYGALEEKWDSATYVGDKLGIPRMQYIWRSLPEARFVCIVRDIEQVAASWDVRARNPKDLGWAAKNDARQSVVQWNESLRRIRRAVKHRPDQAVVVEHSRFFGDADGAGMTRVLDWLELDRAPAMDEHFAGAHARFVDTVSPKERTLPPDVAGYLRETADRAVWRQLLRRAI